MVKLKPALQTSLGRLGVWQGASLLNCYAEKSDGDKRDDFTLITTPGLTEWADIGSGPIRGSIVVGGVLYVVSGSGLYSVDSGGAATSLGLIAGSPYPVSMASNYSEVCIAADGMGYVYSGGALQTPFAFAVSDVEYADGYMLWSVQASEQFFISALDDALTYDAADIASVEGFPDNLVGVMCDHREVHFPGEKSWEIWYNSGDAGFPFIRQGNAFIERGCFDRDSLVKIDNSISFVGSDRIVYRLSGYQPQRISTHAIELLLKDATYARAFGYTLEGHKFYVLEYDGGTIAFDHATGAWHTRQSWDSDFWRVGGAIDAYDMLLLTDRGTGQLYRPSNDVLTENGSMIAAEILLPAIEAARASLIMYAFEVVCETGVGNDDAPDPQIMLTYTDDSGHRWSNEMWRSLGAVGEYRTRAVWRTLGQFQQRQMKLRITDPVRKQVLSAYADLG